MKIRTQDSMSYLEFGEVYAADYHGSGAVYVRSRYNNRPALAGVFSDLSRARGVVWEAGEAYRRGDRIFYMPAV